MYEGALADLIDQFGQLPGIGPKSAQRMAMHVLDAEPEDVARLVDAINAVRGRVRHCDICGNLTEEEQCSICRDVRRDPSAICVVQEPKDIQAIEGARVFRGRYHVLGGVIDPIHGVGPDQLNIASLMSRLADGTVTEVILATNPNVEGEATAAYLARMLSTMGVETSRLAMGLPMGGDLEYADSVTLGRALEGRRRLCSVIDEAGAASRSRRAQGGGVSGDGAQRSGARDLRCLSPPRTCVLFSVTHV